MEINRKRVARRLASGLLAGALALGGLAVSGSSVSAKTPTTGSSAVATDGRVGGSDRYETATKAADGFLSRRGSLNTWNAIVVASGSNFPDALSASGLAGALNAPILLVPSDGSMPESVKEWALSRRVQIQTNSAAGVPFTVYVIGGTSSVPEASVTTLMGVLAKDDATPAVSKRIAGATRGETARLVALEKSAAGANLVMSPAKPIFLANEASFADALSIAPYAFNSASPILLTPSESLGADAKAVLTQYLNLGGNNVVILGGKSAVSAAVEEALVTMGFAYANITRVSGADRYETSVAVADWIDAASANFGSGALGQNLVTFANGENFADGLAGAPLTGFGSVNAGVGEARVLVLVKSGSVPAAVSTWLAGLSLTTMPTNMYILGGTSAVTAAVPTGVTAATTLLNATSSLVCVENAAGNLLGIGVKGNLSGANGTDGSIATGEGALFDAIQVSVNGTTQPTAVPTVSYSAVTGVTTVLLQLSNNSFTAGNVISWSGLNELQNTALRRSIAGSTCTVADDAVPPSVLSIDARVPGANNSETGVFYVTFSEGVTTGSVAGGDFASTSTNAVGFAVTAIGASNGLASLFKVQQFNDADADHVIDNGEATVALAAGNIITVAVNAAIDASGNTGPAVAATKTVNAITDADVTAPTLTGAMTCTQGAEVTLINKAGGTLTMTADGIYGPQGVNGNLYTFKVTNVRGQLIPKVVVDGAAKTITLTGDLNYSSEADVVKSMENDGIIAWDFNDTANGASLTAASANLTAGNYATAGATPGAQSCATTITASENIQSAATLTAATVVAGVQYAAAGVITMSTTAGSTKFSITAITTIPLPVAAGTTAITLSGSVRDIAGNGSLVGVAF